MDQAGRVKINLEPTRLAEFSNHDLYVFDSTGEIRGVSEREYSYEYLSIDTEPGDYFIRVVPYEDKTGGYEMEVNIDTRTTAPPDSSPPPIGAAAPCGAGASMALTMSMMGLLGFAGVSRKRYR